MNSSTQEQSAAKCSFKFNQINSDQIEISISAQIKSIVRIYRGYIGKQMLEKCHLADFNELQQYLLESVANWDINEQELKFTLVAQTNMRGKKNKIDLITIPLDLIDAKQNYNNKLSNITERCLDKQELSNAEIKDMFMQILNYIQQQEEGASSNEVIDSVIAKITIAGNQVEHLKSHIISIEQKIEEQLKQNQIQMADRFHKIQVQQDMQAQQLKQLKQSFKQDLSQVKNNQELLSNEWKIQLDKAIKKQIESASAKFAQLTEQYNVLCQMITIEFNKKQEQLMKPGNKTSENKKKTTLSFDQLFTVVKEETDNYIIDDSKATKVSSKNGNSGINGKIPIVQKSSFALKVQHTKAWGISIGIKDLTSNQIIKYGGNGWISNCASTIYSQGKGLNSGDAVTINVDLPKGIIKWKVENKKTNYSYETKCENTKIAQPERFWVPFIQMSTQHDSVQII